jgi:hypothetical protein
VRDHSLRTGAPIFTGAAALFSRVVNQTESHRSPLSSACAPARSRATHLIKASAEIGNIIIIGAARRYRSQDIARSRAISYKLN